MTTRLIHCLPSLPFSTFLELPLTAKVIIKVATSILRLHRIQGHPVVKVRGNAVPGPPKSAEERSWATQSNILGNAFWNVVERRSWAPIGAGHWSPQPSPHSQAPSLPGSCRVYRTVNLAQNIGSLVTEFTSVTHVRADAKYTEMKRCFIMQIGVCCIRWIPVDIELFGTRIALSGPHIALRAPHWVVRALIIYIVPGPPNLYFNHWGHHRNHAGTKKLSSKKLS